MEISNHNRFKAAYISSLKLGTVGFASILTCIIISNLSLFSPNWPFALFASFSETLVLALPVLIGLLVLSWRKATLPIILLAVCAFYPFYTFKKFVNPTGQSCAHSQCVSIVAANLRHHPTALINLAETKAKDADILIIVELPYMVTLEDLLALFPMDGKSQIALITNPEQKLGSRLAVISQEPLVDVTLQIEKFFKPNPRQRGIVRFEYEVPRGEPLSFAVVHPPPPKGKTATENRDAYLSAASRPLTNKSNFIMIGDFNMTPWESGFSDLPGKRAGNPRWSRTWNARKFWQRITIDHALVGEGVTVIEAGVLPDVGSDHFPIHLIVQPN